MINLSNMFSFNTLLLRKRFPDQNLRSYSSLNLYYYWERLQAGINNVRWNIRYPGNLYASISFMPPYPLIIDFDVLILAFIQLLEQYAYKLDSNYIKFTIGYNMNLPNTSDLSFTLGKAIPLYDSSGCQIEKRLIYDQIDKLVRFYGDRYQDAVITGVFMNIYYETLDSDSVHSFVDEHNPKLIGDIIKVMESEIIRGSFLPEVKSLMYKQKRIPSHITSIKRTSQKESRPFIVADFETVVENNVHVPYAGGFLVVKPGDDLTSLPPYRIQTFFSENYIMVYPKFEDRCKRMLFDFIYNLEVCVRKSGNLRTVYFHNLARFDGMFLLRYYADRSNRYIIKPLVRNHQIYEIKVFIGNKFLMRFRDSCTLLPRPLSSLGKTLCPELGAKGSIDHDNISVSNLKDQSESLIDYMRQDILILGGVMLKAQEINWSKYEIDIEDVMTVSSLSLKIFRKKYLDDEAFHINIPTRNQDTFIRRGYYGGHVDVYKPMGENLYYYDVNSLYPFIMKTYPMPCGVPVWHTNLKDVELDSLFGFIEAYVVCPTSIERPFLPHKDKNGTLIFPTGKFVGVYYSEELKYARDIGYRIIPLRGYLFDKKPSPFEGLISDLYESRLEAKKKGDEAMTFVYKLLMNSLYGRFGMNPESIVTVICNHKQYLEYMRKDNFQDANKLNENYYIVKYISNSTKMDEDDWKAPKMSGVHLSAAITACARIHMYPHIARKDCYYTDTDSIVLGSPLPDELISSTELGLFKMEYTVKKGIFLAPKSYMLEIEDGKEILKHKGPAKDLVTSDWFKQQLADPSRKEEKEHMANFRLDWNKLQIITKKILLLLGQPLSVKRVNIYNEKEEWIDTRSIHVIDIGTQDATTIFKYEEEARKEEEQQQIKEKDTDKDKENDTDNETDKDKEKKIKKEKVKEKEKRGDRPKLE